MKFSRLFSKTLREQQRDADTRSYDLLLRAGYIRPLSSGIYSYLNFGQRSQKKIENILREEMDKIGGDEICMPIVHPADIWKKTNRWFDIDESLLRFQDRTGKDMVLAMTHEEVVAELTSKEITTYKQLPKLVYQIQTKYRDEARARGGLIRVREFTMKDAYSLDVDQEGLEKQYKANYDAYFRIFNRVGLPVVVIQSDTGMMGGKIAHEFMYVTPIGEDTIFICDECGYKANREVATVRKEYSRSQQRELKKIHTPNAKTIKDLSTLLSREEKEFAKVVFYTGTINDKETVIVSIVRGDMDVNSTKIQNATKAKDLKYSTDKEINSIKAVVGYASPLGIDREKAIVIVDDLVANTNNLVIGANEEHYHYEGSCYGRDYNADIVADIVVAYDGALCPMSESNNCTLKSVRGIEVGNIFQLGTKYTEALGAHYIDEKGKKQIVVMGSYGIGVGRLLACLAEEYNDEKGLKLPISVAPYQVIISALLDDETIKQQADDLYELLIRNNFEVIYDDRENKVASLGEKLNDADLIGIPIRLLISKRSISKGGVEVKIRTKLSSEIVSIQNIVPLLRNIIDSEFVEIGKTILLKQ